MAEEPRDPNRPTPERKPPSFGGNAAWYLLILAVMTLFLFNWMETNNRAELSYGDLVRLIEQGAPAKNPRAAIEIHETSPGQDLLVRYSDLDSLKIGPTEVTGTLVRQQLKSGGARCVELSANDLLELVQKGAPSKNPQAFIDVREGLIGRRQTVRYSGLDKLTLWPHELTGMVVRRVLSGPAQPAGTAEAGSSAAVGGPVPEDRVPFRTAWSAAERLGAPLAKALEKHGFADVKIEAKTNFTVARMGLENDNNDLFKLLKKNGFQNVAAEKAPSGWHSLLPMFILTAAIMGVFFFMMRRMGGPGSAIAFGRSRGKLYAQEDLGISFEDVAGIDEAVEELREVVDFLRSPEKYQVLGGRIPKGVLLVGPPGTGKTLLAKAIAGEAGVPFFSLSGSDFVEMFVGVGAARVRDMFQQAQAKAPCIVFIDELDALGKTRGSGVVGGHDEREQTLNALLVEMDGFSSNSGVIVMAATNRPETLDPALLRPGRFDRHVLVDRPDVRGREQILKVHGAKVKLDESVDLKEVAKITSGFVGADLANLINEAALLAARKGKPTVTMEELNEGVERITAGLEKKQRVMHADEKQRVAYHESAHALVAYSLPNTDPVHKVSIIPRGLAALGYTMQRPEGDRYLMTQSELESRVQVLLAGTAAEEIIFGDVSTGAQNDLERATELARSMVMDYGMSRLGKVNYRESGRAAFLGGENPSHRRDHSEQTCREIDEEIARIVGEAMENVRGALESRRPALVALAERLIEKEVIDTEELRQVIEANSPGARIVPGTSDTAARRTMDDRAAPPSDAKAADVKTTDAKTAEGG